ncbi:Transposable element Tc3 transposase [Operophtera brumata]|uniref:Transposable element Tc3 transposase n=1 Tax=Operophtera brumata TaxID=104452 RepID=A0A0L7LHW4_OPEBR|nr:Transposable element Tc3 transposase [Operophtera brumata]
MRTMVNTMLDDIPLAALRELWFQQDGAPPHYSRAVREYLTEEFGNHWNGRGGPIAWPPRLPVLTPMDFFLWSEIKRLVYVSEPTSAQEFKQRIIDAFDKVKRQDVLISLKNYLHVFSRARVCISEEGGHFEQLLKYL